MPTPREQRRDDLHSYAAAHPTGVTVVDMMKHFGWDLATANIAIRDLREFLGDTDVINFPAEPSGTWGPWNYKLVGTLDEVKPWMLNRQKDAETRLRTMSSMMKSIVKATNGRTKQGQKARTMEKSLRRLVEDLHDIDANGVTP